MYKKYHLTLLGFVFAANSLHASLNSHETLHLSQEGINSSDKEELVLSDSTLSCSGTAKNEIVDPEPLLEFIHQTSKTVTERSGYTPVLVLGKAGMGKTVTVHYLRGESLVKLPKQSSGDDSDSSDDYEQYLTQKMVIDLADESKKGAIGHDDSKRLVPAFHETKEELVLCDCSGFDSDRGALYKIALAYAVKHSKGIQAILLIVDQATIDTTPCMNSRDKKFKALLTTLNQIFTDPALHAASIFFGITKRHDWQHEKHAIAHLRKRRKSYLNKIIQRYEGINKEAKRNLKKATSTGGVREILAGKANYQEKSIINNSPRNNNESKPLFDDNDFGKYPLEMLHIKGLAFLNAMIPHLENNLFFINPLQPKQKQGIITRLQKSPVIHKDQLNFIGDKATYMVLQDFMRKKAKEGLRLIAKLRDCAKAIKRTEGIMAENNLALVDRACSSQYVELASLQERLLEIQKKELADMRKLLSNTPMPSVYGSSMHQTKEEKKKETKVVAEKERINFQIMLVKKIITNRKNCAKEIAAVAKARLGILRQEKKAYKKEFDRNLPAFKLIAYMHASVAKQVGGIKAFIAAYNSYLPFYGGDEGNQATHEQPDNDYQEPGDAYEEQKNDY